MATKECKWKFEWANEDEFKLTQEDDQGVETVLLCIEENGCIASVWGSAAGMVTQYLNNLMQKIGDEMKAGPPDA